MITMKNLAKFGGGGLLIALVALGTLVAIRYLRYRSDPAYQNEQAAREYVEQEKHLIQQMKDDPYGGETPEQTLRLFIDALKKGDTDLAAKYFVIGEQERWKKKLLDIKERDVLKFMLEDLQSGEMDKKDPNEAFFTVANEKNEVTTQMILKRTSLNKRWKITEL